MIELHGNRTPNPQKIVIFLEEAELEYRIIEYDLLAGDQLTQTFRRINPNNRVPAIIDLNPLDQGEPLVIFESCAILLYLAEKTNRFIPTDERGRSMVTQWLFWQASGLGPMMGQAAHFARYAPKRIDYAITRYSNEADRLLNVMETRLREAEFLAGTYSIADMACWPWINASSIDAETFPAIARWKAALAARPAYRRVLTGDAAIPAQMLKGHITLTPEQWSVAFGDRLLQAARPDATRLGQI